MAPPLTPRALPLVAPVMSARPPRSGSGHAARPAAPLAFQPRRPEPPPMLDDELHAGRDESGNVSGLLALLLDVMPSNPPHASPNNSQQEQPWLATYAHGQGGPGVPRMPDLPDQPPQQQPHYLAHQPQMAARQGDEKRRRPEPAARRRRQDPAERRSPRSAGGGRKRQRTEQQQRQQQQVRRRDDEHRARPSDPLHRPIRPAPPPPPSPPPGHHHRPTDRPDEPLPFPRQSHSSDGKLRGSVADEDEAMEDLLASVLPEHSDGDGDEARSVPAEEEVLVRARVGWSGFAIVRGSMHQEWRSLPRAGDDGCLRIRPAACVCSCTGLARHHRLHHPNTFNSRRQLR